MTRLRCPKCGVIFNEEESRTPPFCSPRCKLMDLGAWLDESYGIPVDEEIPEDVIQDMAENRKKDSTRNSTETN